MVNLGTPRCSFANWQLPVSKLATPNFQTVNSQYKNCQLPFFKLSPPNFQTVKSQFSNCHIPVFKLSTKQSLLFLPPGASETANFTNFTNFANWVAKVATDNSQFSNCQQDNHSSISIPGHQKLPTWIHQLHQLYQLSYQSCNWQLPVSKLSTGQSLLYFYPGASETANLTNFANWVAKVATDNSQFPNCQCY